MARKSRKAKLMERAGSVQDPIIAIVLLLLGVTFGIVIDVVM
jgi:hypothetical protein